MCNIRREMLLQADIEFNENNTDDFEDKEPDEEFET